MELGSIIKTKREARGWTVARLARESQVPRPNLSRIESGGLDPRWSTLRRILDALDLGICESTSGATPLDDVIRRAATGRRRLASTDAIVPDPWARLSRRAALGEDVRQEAAVLAESARR